MFACFNSSSPEEIEAKAKSRQITKTIENDFIKFNQIIKLLLLGTGESGKTTIIKQMKILHINGFSEVERKEKITHIKQNIHESIYSIVNSLNKIDPPLEINVENAKISEEFILNIGPKEPANFTDEYYEHVKTLWANETIQAAFKRSNEYQLIDSAKHFLDKIDIIRAPDYVPDDLDILFCRIKTVAISKIEFSIPVPKSRGGGIAKFWMFDVGGQRGYRKKWIQVFEGIHAVLFLIACSDFDQTLREDPTKNRLKEGLEIFDQIFWTRYLLDAAMIVFLNKQDILKQKVEDGKRIQNYFPEYEKYKLPSKYAETNSEYEKVKYFIRDEVTNITKKSSNTEQVVLMPGIVGNVKPMNKKYYIHFTTATNTKNIKLVFESVHDSILEGILKGENLF